jgi:hypothetical protein
MPSYSTATNSEVYASMYLGDDFPQQRVPQRTKVPIIDGAFVTDTKLFYNADLTPPNTRYCTWFYDATGRQVAGPTDLFAVTVDPTTLVIPTLPTPITPTTEPLTP